jgi:hypothetical protein
MAVWIASSDCKRLYKEVQILARTLNMKERVTVDEDIVDTCAQDDTFLLEA